MTHNKESRGSLRQVFRLTENAISYFGARLGLTNTNQVSTLLLWLRRRILLRSPSCGDR